MPRLRKLLALLLLLALPLKGVAGMLFGACPAMAAPVSMAAKATTATAQQAADALPCHHQAADDTSAVDVASASCSHCASCLAPMVGMPSMPAAPDLSLGQTQPAPVATEITEHAPAVPRPPPRR